MSLRPSRPIRLPPRRNPHPPKNQPVRCSSPKSSILPLSSDWSIFTVTGSDDADPDKVTVEAEDGMLVWDFDSEYLYYYLFYNAFEYEDVRL
ncbi:MAG: hypothetical protein M0C28_33915 [Candidatus Moduliflexus flocculans]|nr:hypothetical protein [Candidatus Moduliflexus flocculans]